MSCFAQIARELGADQPVYGIQAHGLDEGQAPLPSFEEMAAQYVARHDRVRRLVHLMPVLTGGGIALEIAQQLQASGEEVGC